MLSTKVSLNMGFFYFTLATYTFFCFSTLNIISLHIYWKAYFALLKLLFSFPSDICF